MRELEAVMAIEYTYTSTHSVHRLKFGSKLMYIPQILEDICDLL